MRIKDGFFWNNGFRVILFSISSLMLAYLIYTKFTNPYYNDLVMVTPILLNLSITIIIITFMSSIALCFGLWNIYVSKTTNSNNLRYYISIPFKEKKYVVMMILTGISYGIIFSFLSQITIKHIL